jgi:rod shape-determining protein MreD
MRIGAASLLLAFSIVFQALALDLYRSGSLAPDFPLLALLYLSFFAPPGELMFLAALTALTIDLISLDPLGTRLAGYLPALWMANRLRRGFVVESAFLRGAVTWAAAWAAFSLEGGFLAWREGRWLGLGYEFKSALYTAFLGIAVHAALDRCRNQLGWARDRFFA